MRTIDARHHNGKFVLILAALAWAVSGTPCLAAEEPETLGEVKVLAVKEDQPAEGPFLPDVSGTKIYSGKKTAVIDLDARPAIVNNNHRQTLVKTPGLLLSEETTPLFSVGYRGLEPHRAQFTQVLKDGIPIHADMFGYPEAYYTPPLQSVEKIEFVHGGAALMYGPQPGGALNFVTRDPYPDVPFTAYTENAGGTDNLYSNYSALSANRGPWSAGGYFHRRQGDGFRDSNSDFSVMGGGPKVILDRGEQGRWEMAFDTYREEHGEPGGLTRAAFDSNPDQTNLRFDRFRLNREAGSLIYTRDLSPETQVEVKAFGGYYKRFSKRQRGGGFGVAPAGADSSTNTIETQRFYTAGFEPRVRHTYEAFGSPDHTVAAGLLLYNSDSPRVDKRGITPDADTGPVRNDSDRSMQYLSLFAENRFRFGDLSIVPGVRLEQIWQRVKENINLDKSSRGAPLQRSREYDVVPLFGLGASYDVKPSVAVYGNVSQAYRPKIFTQSVPTGATRIINGDLEEGRAWQAEVGLRGKPTPYLTWDASLFHMNFDNQIGTVGAEILNVGEAVHQGFELAGEVDLIGWSDAARGTRLADRFGSFSVFGNLTLLDAEFVDGPRNGNEPQYAPKYQAKGGLQYARGERAKVALTSTFVGQHFADDGHTPNRFIPSYKVWDLTAEFQVYKDTLTLFGGINNLFDEHYYARVRGDGIDPAYERNFYAGATLKY